MIRIQSQLEKLGMRYESAETIQEKDGVLVARILKNDESLILKIFEKAEYRREIENYRILKSLGIPTIQVKACTDSALLLEDIHKSPIFRLGEEGDMDNPEIAEKIAVWYRQLHEKGRTWDKDNGESLYEESAYFTKENIEGIKEKTETQDKKIWQMLTAHFEEIEKRLKAAKKNADLQRFLLYESDRLTGCVFRPDV